MSDVAGTGSWVSTTQIYTSAATTGTVTVGQWISLYTGTPTTPTTIARIIGVSGGSGSAWVITLSNISYSGTQPSALATGATYKAQVGGAFAGPTGAVTTPVGLIASTATDVNGNPPRINFSNGQTYSISAQLVMKVGVVYQGMTSTPGDLGKATFDGGSPSVSFNMISNAAGGVVRDMIIQNNGTASGVGYGIIVQACGILERVSVNNIYGAGIEVSAATLIECEAYSCNKGANANFAGFYLTAPFNILNCVAGHNSVNNVTIIPAANAIASLTDCIVDSSSGVGVNLPNNQTNTPFTITFDGCVFANNSSHGISWTVDSTAQRQQLICRNCIFSNNGTGGTGYGAFGSNVDPNSLYRFINCAFYGNATGQTSGFANSANITGSITLTGDPFTADSTGNFAPNATAGAGAAVVNAGRGNFTQLYSGYTTPTTSYPPVGAVTNLPASSGTFPTASQVLSGVVFGPTGNLTGNVVLPVVSQVESGILYGPSSSLAGTYPGNTPAGSTWFNTSGSTWATPEG